MQQPQRRPHPIRWMWAGLGVMFVLIGVAAVIGALYPGSSQPVSPSPMPNYFGWFWGVVGLVFACIFFVWVFGWIFGGGMRYRYSRWGFREEYAILRERYARGEITKEQLDQMMRDLDQQVYR